MAQGKIVRQGASYYLLLDKDVKNMVEEGDLLEFEPIAIAPQGKISEAKLIQTVKTVSVENSSEYRVNKKKGFSKTGKVHKRPETASESNNTLGLGFTLDRATECLTRDVWVLNDGSEVVASDGGDCIVLE